MKSGPFNENLKDAKYFSLYQSNAQNWGLHLALSLIEASHQERTFDQRHPWPHVEAPASLATRPTLSHRHHPEALRNLAPQRSHLAKAASRESRKRRSPGRSDRSSRQTQHREARPPRCRRRPPHPRHFPRRRRLQEKAELLSLKRHDYRISR